MTDSTPPAAPAAADLEGFEAAVVHRLSAVVECLGGVGFGRMLPDEIDGAARLLGRVEGRLAVARARFVRRVDQLSGDGHAPAAVDVLQRRGLSRRDARRQVERAGTLADFPALKAALADGTVSTSHVDVLGGVVADLSDADGAAWRADDVELAGIAGRETPDGFRRSLLARRVIADALNGVPRAEVEHTKNTATTGEGFGRWWLHLDADAETGMRFETLLQREMDTMRARGDLADLHPDRHDDIGHLRFYATLRLLSRNGTRDGGSRSAGQVAEIGVLIDADTLITGLHDRSVCELTTGQPLPVEAARRLACKAGIYPIVLDGAGVVLDQGRLKRLATADQRRALRAMYRTCAVGTCAVPFDRCEIHHISPWGPGGNTDLADLAPVCPFHHHRVHDHGWTMTLDADRTLRLYQPDGTLDSVTPLQPLTPPAPSASPTSRTSEAATTAPRDGDHHTRDHDRRHGQKEPPTTQPADTHTRTGPPARRSRDPEPRRPAA